MSSTQKQENEAVQTELVWQSPETFYGYYRVYKCEEGFFACHNDRRVSINLKTQAQAVQACQDNIDLIVAKYGRPEGGYL